MENNTNDTTNVIEVDDRLTDLLIVGAAVAIVAMAGPKMYNSVKREVRIRKMHRRIRKMHAPIEVNATSVIDV